MLIEKMSKNNGSLLVSEELIGAREEEKPRIRISSLGNDLQKQYLDITLPDHMREEITDQKQRVFDLGHIIEQEIFRQLSNIIHSKDQIVYTGIKDHKDHEIKGEIDCLYTDDHGITYVVDVKSMSKNSFSKLVELQNIKDSHYVYYVQLQMYMHFLGYDDAMILAYCKDNSDMTEVFCAYDEDFCEQQLKRIDILIDHLKRGQVPQLEYPMQQYYKTQKVRNKEEYKGLGYIIQEPHPLNRYNPYIDTDQVVIEDSTSKDIIFDERKPSIRVKK